jgi:hypothetical protein
MALCSVMPGDCISGHNSALRVGCNGGKMLRRTPQMDQDEADLGHSGVGAASSRVAFQSWENPRGWPSSISFTNAHGPTLKNSAREQEARIIKERG